MIIKQLSVFIENTEGILECVTDTLCKHNINIVSLSLVDASEYSVLRMIVSDPERGREVLKEEGLLAKLTDVIAVKTPQKPGMLHDILTAFRDANLHVKYMYTYSSSENYATVIMRLSKLDTALSLIKQKGYEVCTDKEAYEIVNLN